MAVQSKRDRVTLDGNDSTCWTCAYTRHTPMTIKYIFAQIVGL